jgi:hypothetical protein
MSTSRQLTAEKLLLTRHTEPQPELRLLLDKLRLELPAQPAPKISAETPRQQAPCSADLQGSALRNINHLGVPYPSNPRSWASNPSAEAGFRRVVAGGDRACLLFGHFQDLVDQLAEIHREIRTKSNFSSAPRMRGTQAYARSWTG